MEKVCVYRDSESLTRTITWYEYVSGWLQELSDLFTDANIVPTISKLQNLFNGSNLWGLVDESCTNQGIGKMPKRVQELIREDSAKKVDTIKEKASNLINKPNSNPIEWEFYQVNNGKVEIRSDYKEILTDRFSIYIDTESKKAVYDKWLILEKACKEFNQAVAEAPKVCTFYESMVKINHLSADLYNPQYLMGLAVPDRFSLARLDPDGSIVLKGKNFEYIK